MSRKSGPEDLRSLDRQVATRVKLARSLAGLGVADVADALQITCSQLESYEAGRNRISAGRIYQLSRVLNVPVAWFFEGEGFS